MMIDKRLLKMAGKNRKYIYYCVLFQWLGLLTNAAMIFMLSQLVGHLFSGTVTNEIRNLLIVVGIGIPLKFLFGIVEGKMSLLASSEVKSRLRENIYQKLLQLGLSYRKHISTAEAVQLSGEGVEQLEIYFGRYLPQFFYSLLAPLTLFVMLSFVSLKAAFILLICVPLTPLAIVLVQKFAKKLFHKYWGEYTKLGDGFLENVQGLTTLKIYKADERKNNEMNVQAEHFRKITMKVLTMQLNSITLMDLVAYGGAALGAIVALVELSAGRINLAGAIMIILLSAEFFIPLRLLGSYFHIAMNGFSASGKMFKLLDIPEEDDKTVTINNTEIELQNLSFSYDESRTILHNINMSFPKNSFTAIIGESGSGKSTIASLIIGSNTGYSGFMTVGGEEHSLINEQSLLNHIKLIGYQSHLFAGTVRENLKLSNPMTNDGEMISVLEQVKLWNFLNADLGLDTLLMEGASNLSGGQKQRLALARALLCNSDILIFDEATSNIDVESEMDIMMLIEELAENKTVIVISHRLANVVNADNIYVLKDGEVCESGKHSYLIEQSGQYSKLWYEQQELEQIRKEAALI